MCETQLRSHPKAHLGKALLPSSCSSCQDSLLPSYWTEDISSFLAIGQSLPSIPCNEDVSTMAACFPKTCRRVTRWGCNLRTEATSHDICHALLVRVSGPAHTQEGGIPWGYEPQRQGHWGPSQNLSITGTCFLWAASSQEKAKEKTVNS